MQTAPSLSGLAFEIQESAAFEKQQPDMSELFHHLLLPHNNKGLERKAGLHKSKVCTGAPLIWLRLNLLCKTVCLWKISNHAKCDEKVQQIYWSPLSALIISCQKSIWKEKKKELYIISTALAFHRLILNCC